MEDNSREARVTLGTKTYLLRTALKPKQFDEIVEFSQRLFSSLDSKVDQERRLVLGWMYMAYKLKLIEEKLNLLLTEYYSDGGSAPEKSGRKEGAE